MNINIPITAEDISEGIPKSPNSCPIARAIRKKFNPTFITVDPWIIHFRLEDKLRRNKFFFQIPTNVQAQKFIQAFDLGEPVKPIVITLKIPNKTGGQFTA